MRTIKFVNPAQFTNRGTVAFLEQVIESAKLIDSKCDKTMFENLESLLPAAKRQYRAAHTGNC